MGIRLVEEKAIGDRFYDQRGGQTSRRSIHGVITEK